MTDPTATIDTTAEAIADAAQTDDAGTEPITDTEEAPGGRQLPGWAPMVGAAVAGLVVAAPFLRTARQSHVSLRPGEEIAMKIRPRRGVIRYLDVGRAVGDAAPGDPGDRHQRAAPARGRVREPRHRLASPSARSAAS